MTLASLLLISTLTAASIGKAPELPPWPEGLPNAVRMDDLGVLFPDALAQVVLERLLYLEKYPVACQAALDAQAYVLEERGQNATAVALASHQAEAPGWAWYEVALVAAGTLSAGLVAGAVYGATR
jgi:hypothetical protein